MLPIKKKKEGKQYLKKKKKNIGSSSLDGTKD